MTFQQLSYLVEVAKTGSINKTSRQLFVSQSCISSSLQQLENELNVKLLTRNSRGVELPAEGKELVQYAASILEQKKLLQSLCASSPSTIST
ncbi:MAG: LysR family transcriptional regulator, partial [Lachnospiraceae bacterium]|nr:LysR family transcriptional regulator [Lachnospiraceae bacterium]